MRGGGRKDGEHEKAVVGETFSVWEGPYLRRLGKMYVVRKMAREIVVAHCQSPCDWPRGIRGAALTNKENQRGGNRVAQGAWLADLIGVRVPRQFMVSEEIRGRLTGRRKGRTLGVAAG